ncbi:hypothetical protein B0T16DRAFT_402714 [Cercophora newfieldiana]|uniref:Uncharacterized protein n=1 Tax=Cercophora newfieldiana TaxID=92897 RepID=A0AA39YSP9_9PEZI|nr:hypothetical protein B0T16DRAFT_402714 [Cercophora newfieldiana]
MAQQGTTEIVSKDSQTTAESKNTASPIPAKGVAQNDAQQWEVVETPATNPDPGRESDSETNVQGHKVSSHFDIKLGWGKYKFTLFSWDMNVKNTTTRRAPRR